MKIYNWIWDNVYELGQGFLKQWQVTDEIIEWIFFWIHIQPFMNDSNSRNNNPQGLKNLWLDRRDCVLVGESFLKQWEVTDKIMEWIFVQFTFNILQMT